MCVWGSRLRDSVEKVVFGGVLRKMENGNTRTVKPWKSLLVVLFGPPNIEARNQHRITNTRLQII